MVSTIKKAAHTGFCFSTQAKMSKNVAAIAKSYCSTNNGVITSWAQNQNMNTFCQRSMGIYSTETKNVATKNISQNNNPQESCNKAKGAIT